MAVWGLFLFWGLARIGQNTFFGVFLKKGGPVDELIQACEFLSRHHIGALIAIERDIGLKNYIESSIVLDGKVTQELLITLFKVLSISDDFYNQNIFLCGK